MYAYSSFFLPFFSLRPRDRTEGGDPPACHGFYPLVLPFVTISRDDDDNDKRTDFPNAGFYFRHIRDVGIDDDNVGGGDDVP